MRHNFQHIQTRIKISNMNVDKIVIFERLCVMILFPSFESWKVYAVLPKTKQSISGLKLSLKGYFEGFL